jgi:uncharacterized protein involved in outer membrane biogenesis
MKDVDLAELLKRLEVKVPFALAGRLTVELKLSIPVNTPRDIKAYRLNGTASLPRFTVEKLELQDVKARVTLNEGVLKLEELDGALLDNSVPGAGPPPRGTFRGSASYGVEPAGDLNANLTLDRLPLARALQLLPQAAATDTAGAVSGQFTFFAPAGALQDVARYRATARLSSDRLRGYGLQLDGVALALNLDQGVAKLTELRGNLEGTGLSGGGELRLAGNYPYSAELTVTGADLAAINRLAPNVKPPIRLAGKVDVKAEAKGTANPASLALTGSSKATGLKVENFTLGVLDFRFAADTDRLRVTDLKADLYRGAITGEATLPFTATAPGSINLRLRNVDVGAITRDVPQLPVKLEGQVDGTVTASLPPAAPDKPRQPEARIEFLRTRNLKVSDIPADQLTGTVTVQGGVAHFDLKGGLAGGTFGVVGDLPLPGQAPPAAPLPPMREPTVRLQGLQLDQLWPALGLDLLAPLRGELEGTLTLHRGRAGAWEGSGSLTVPSLRWNETLPFNLLSEPLTVTLSFRDSELRGRIRSGAVGGGTVAGRLAYSLAPGGRREFNVALSHVPVERLLVAYPDIASEITGPVDLTVSGSVGPSARGSGSLLAGRAKVYQAELTDLRLPFDWDYDAPSGFGRLAVRDAGAQASLGRATGRMTLMFGGVNRLDGSIQFSDLDLRAFLTQFTTYGSYGAGRITGRFDFGGNDVRSVNDVSGTMTARITQAQALQLPVLRQLVPFLGPAASGATTFNQGDLRANLARGIVRVQRLALSSSAVQLFADGTVTIEQKRLALDIVARTGPLGGPNPSVLQALGMRIPAVGPIPVGLLLEVSQMLSHLTVKVHISGTIANPTVRVNPVPLMSQEAVLFLVGRTPAGLFVP